MHADGLAAAKAIRIPGCCVFCEEPLPDYHRTNRRSVLCGEPDCAKAYMRAYLRDHPRYPRYLYDRSSRQRIHKVDNASFDAGEDRR